MATPLIDTPEQRQDILSLLKHGPALGDREALAVYTQQVYKHVTGKDLKAACDKKMEEWRMSRRGKAEWNQTFIW